MEIQLQTLSDKAFSKYGKVILAIDSQRPDISGEGWDCWYPLDMVDQNRPPYFGIVVSQPQTPQVKYMERHLDRVEYIIALDHPIIQVVGLSNLENSSMPALSQTEAFLLLPGQIVMIERCIWHAAGIALNPAPSSYLFLLGKASDDSGYYDSGLVQFTNGAVMTIRTE